MAEAEGEATSFKWRYRKLLAVPQARGRQADRECSQAALPDAIAFAVLPKGSSPFCFLCVAQRLSSSCTYSVGAIRNRPSDKIMARTVTSGSAASPTCPHRWHLIVGGRMWRSDRI